MGIVIDTGVKPQSLKCAAEAVVEGFIYKDDGSGRMTVVTSQNDSAVAISMESSIDPQTAAAKTMTVGDKMPFAMLGSGMIVTVLSATTMTYQENGAVYIVANGGQDGAAGNASSSATKIGHYMGKDNYATTAANEPITVRLDVAPIA